MIEQSRFFQFYKSQFGSRWDSLFSLLQQENPKISLSNPWQLGVEAYQLDPASFKVAQLLQVNKDEEFYDACAAPGGKSLCVIFNSMAEAIYNLNDISPDRVLRLRRNVLSQLPELQKKHVRIFQTDASRIGIRFPNRFDKVLLDAPCSGERDVANSKKKWESWTEKGSQRLAIRQYALLCSMSQAIKTSGEILYVTCSLSPYENDEVIRKFQKKKSGQLTILNSDIIGAERTEFGYQLLPDSNEGAGPLYFVHLKKN